MIYVHMRPEVTKYDTTAMTATINKLVLGDYMKIVVW